MTRPPTFVTAAAGVAVALAVAGELAVGFAARAAAQDVPWIVPSSPLRFDYTAKDAPYKVVFLPDGMALEAAVNFPLLDHQRIALEALLPEAGRFEVVNVNAASKVAIENVNVQPTNARPASHRGHADFVLQLPKLSPRQARSQAESEVFRELAGPLRQARGERERKKKPELVSYLRGAGVTAPDKDEELFDLYDKLRAAEIGADDLRQRLADFADRRGEWFTPPDRKSWETANGWVLLETYVRCLAWERAEKYLTEIGLQFDLNSRNVRQVLDTRLLAVDALLSGKSLDEKNVEARAALRSLSSDDAQRLRRNVIVMARCRFYPQTDPRDPNSQWFHGQRVQCQIRGVASIRLEGRLDPAAGDHSDWWLLVGFDRQHTALALPQNDGLRCELFDEATAATKLRIVAAGGQPVDYVVELRPRVTGKETQRVIHHESPFLNDAKFPY